ncbi:MAG: hypothetical protein ABIV94_05905 [Acidimicrobiales bacterium]
MHDDQGWVTPGVRSAIVHQGELLRALAVGRRLQVGEVGGPAALPALAASGERFDSIVSVLQLCRAPELAATVATLRVLLEERGRLLFIEPTAGGGATGAGQRLLAARAPAGGRFARDVPAALRAGGLVVTDCDRLTLPMRWPWRTFVAGSAR